MDVGLRFYSQKLFTGSMEFIILNSVLEIPIFGSLGPWYIALLNRFSCYFALVKFTTIFFFLGQDQPFLCTGKFLMILSEFLRIGNSPIPTLKTISSYSCH